MLASAFVYDVTGPCVADHTVTACEQSCMDSQYPEIGDAGLHLFGGTHGMKVPGGRSWGSPALSNR